MDTQALIRRLADDVRSPEGPRLSLTARLALVTVTSVVVVILIVSAAFGFRPDLPEVLTSVRGLTKFAGVLVIAAVALLALARTAMPGQDVPVQALGVAFCVPIAGGLILAAWSGVTSELGGSAGCVLSILGLSLLPLGAVLIGLRAGASTDLPITGAIAGVLAGAVAAFGFAFTCPMDLSPSVVVWYPAAIGLVGLAGAVIGRHVLAW